MPTSLTPHLPLYSPPPTPSAWPAVPLRVLLPWVHQILGQLGSDVEGPHLAHPLGALARAYPQRMYYAVRMAARHIKGGAGTVAGGRGPGVGEM